MRESASELNFQEDVYAGSLFSGSSGSRGLCGIGRFVGPGSRQAVRDRDRHRGSLGAASACRRAYQGPGHGRRSSLTPDGTSGSRADADCPSAGPDAGGDPQRADRTTRHHCWPGHRLALSRLSQHHPPKKSLHATAQQRPDVAAARHAFIRRQPALDPERLVFCCAALRVSTRPRRQPP